MGERCSLSSSHFVAKILGFSLLSPFSLFPAEVLARVKVQEDVPTISVSQKDLKKPAQSVIDTTYKAVKIGGINKIESNASPMLGKDAATKIQFLLKDIRISGGKSLSDSDLLRFTKKLQKGKVITLYEINRAARNMTKLFHKNGYVLTHVEVDQREPHNGEVVFNVIEGYVTNVELKGEIKGSKEILDGFTGKMITGEPAEKTQLERYLLLLERLPGAVFKDSIISPVPGEPGSFKITRQITHNMAGGSVGFDTRGTKSRGPVNVNYNHRVASGFGMYEQFEAGFSTTADTRENFTPNAKYSQFIGSEGAKIVLSMNSVGGGRVYSSGNTRDSDSANFSVVFSYPLIYTQLNKLTAKIKFNYKNSANTNSNNKGNMRDRLRTGELAAEYEKTDAFRGRMTYGAGVARGFTLLGSTKDSNPFYKSSTTAKSVFTKWTGSVQRLQQLVKNLELLIAFKGQYTKDSLFGAEKFSYGGADTGRGFDGGVASGDRGYSGKMEIDWTTKYDMPFLNKAVWYAFYDGGQTFSIKPGTSERVRTAYSTGVGCKLTITKNVSGFLEIAKPIRLKTSPTLSMQPRVFGGLTAKFTL